MVGTRYCYSVIIPAFNEEKLISNILSLFTCELKEKFDIEVILSDGGSSDSTLAIAEGKVEKVIRHTEDYKQNISRGRNQGALNSLGDVLIFLNADTIIPDPFLFMEKVSDIMKNKKAAAVACAVSVFPFEEKLVDKVFHRVYNMYVRLLNKSLFGMGRGECHIIRKDVFLKQGGYNELYAAGEDFDLYRRIKRSGGKVVFSRLLKVYESPRRYRKYGYTKVLMEWMKNAVSILIFNRPASKEWEAVR